jgi:hypothetical protein
VSRTRKSDHPHAMIAVASARLAGLAGSCARTGTVASTARKVSRLWISLLRALIVPGLQRPGDSPYLGRQ